jgi:hypothetical protein
MAFYELLSIRIAFGKFCKAKSFLQAGRTMNSKSQSCINYSNPFPTACTVKLKKWFPSYHSIWYDTKLEVLICP